MLHVLGDRSPGAPPARRWCSHNVPASMSSGVASSSSRTQGAGNTRSGAGTRPSGRPSSLLTALVITGKGSGTAPTDKTGVAKIATASRARSTGRSARLLERQRCATCIAEDVFALPGLPATMISWPGLPVSEDSSGAWTQSSPGRSWTSRARRPHPGARRSAIDPRQRLPRSIAQPLIQFLRAPTTRIRQLDTPSSAARVATPHRCQSAGGERARRQRTH